MSTERDFYAWISVSGSRRRSLRTIADVSQRPTAGAVAPLARTSPAASPTPVQTWRKGPIDWVEFARGAAFLGILGMTLWMEWRVIASLAPWIARWLAE
ncbi:hypothetical protein I41_25170 [Lacipirellula limnantheis]|uniref:Uncharacterized protein n=1 Tax=Lacipirellula limnantheis TaxID=2528024 RepID=A0A517TY71_9BACT|nr:hypothetical protein I41_25170 [Lacipirellula limnantheis]